MHYKEGKAGSVYGSGDAPVPYYAASRTGRRCASKRQSVESVGLIIGYIEPSEVCDLS